MPRKRQPMLFKTKEEAINDLGENITWYDSTHPDKRYRYKDSCFYCGSRTIVGYIVEELSDGTLIGKPVCGIHFK